MAGSRYEYVKSFELPDPLLPGTFMVLRIDGHAFHRLSEEHEFAKPNDDRALQLMDHAARDVMNEYRDIVLAFGESDEFSFLFRRSTTLYNRRHSKILTNITSLFTSSYVFNWPKYLPDTPLKYPPNFDGRIVLYPWPREVKDYFAWRQADTHINNMYNTIFWALVLQGGETTAQAHATLQGTVSSTKQEMLFSRFKVNYNEISPRYRKGSVLVREPIPPEIVQITAQENTESSTTETPAVATHRRTTKKAKVKTTVELLHCDIIGDTFWDERPYLLDEPM